MHDINRRDFLGYAGTSVIGGAALVGGIESAHAVDYPVGVTHSCFPDDHFDPWIELDMHNLSWNVKEIRKRVGDTPIMAIVKCNAYGHGVVEISQGLQRNGVTHFAVVKVWEAVLLRENKIKSMILNLGAFSHIEAHDLVKHDICQSVFTDTVDILAQEARKQGKQAKVHIKVDIGLGRVGIPQNEALTYILKVGTMPEIKIEGVLTVFTGQKRIPSQVRDFTALCDEAEKRGVSVGLRHGASTKDVASSPPSTYLDMVRPGSCLMGLTPLPNMNVKPVLSLKSRVLLTKWMPAGTKFGWHHIYHVEKDTLFACIPVGVFDGYPPNKSGKTEALIKGRRYRLKGFVSSNHTTIDITGANDIKIGDEVVLIGKQGNEEITNGELTEHSGQSIYRTPTYLNPHIPRLLINT